MKTKTTASWPFRSNDDVIPHNEQQLLYSSETHTSHTVWRVIFGGANIREKSKVAVRINFRGFNFRDWAMHMRIHGMRCTHMVCMHAPSAMCMLLND